MRYKESQMRRYNTQKAAERAHKRALELGFYYSGVVQSNAGCWLLFVTAINWEAHP